MARVRTDTHILLIENGYLLPDCRGIAMHPQERHDPPRYQASKHQELRNLCGLQASKSIIRQLSLRRDYRHMTGYRVIN